MYNKHETNRYNRYQNAAYALNKQAYTLQVEGKSKKQIKKFRFTPCPKSVVLVGADTSLPASQIETESILTHCSCHPSLVIGELLEMEFGQE